MEEEEKEGKRDNIGIVSKKLTLERKRFKTTLEIEGIKNKRPENKKRRLEIKRYLEMMEGLKKGFYSIGVMIGGLKEVENSKKARERFIKLLITK